MPDYTAEQRQLRRIIQVWEEIRMRPGITLIARDYSVATELEAAGLVKSTSHDDCDDTWKISSHFWE